MKPKKGIHSLQFKFKDCSRAFSNKIPLFSTGGGAYEAWGFPNVWYYQKHFYLYKWCVLTINGVK